MWNITKLKIKREIFKSSNKFIFYKPFYNFFHIYIFFIYIDKCLRIYQLNIINKIKEDFQDIKIFLTRKKEKSHDIVVSVTKISQKIKKINLLNIEKNIIEPEKILKTFFNLLLYKGKYKKLFSFLLMFKNFSLNRKNVKRNIRNSWFSGFAKSVLKIYYFEGAILKMYFLGEFNFFWKKKLKCIFWESIFWIYFDKYLS